jgi:hypothetical protein
MNLLDLQKTMCDDLAVRFHKNGDREFLSSRFQYADGDLVCAYLKAGPRGFAFTDRGATLRKFEISGFKVRSNKLDLIRKMTAAYGVQVDNYAITKPIDTGDAKGAFIDFCVAVERVSTLEIQLKHRRPNFLEEAMDYLVSERVEPYRAVYRAWCAEGVDYSRSYPVDFHCNSYGTARNLFAVGSREKGLLVSAVCNFLRANSIYSPSMVVFDADSALPKRHVDRVREAVDEVVFGLSGFEDRVTDFALSS